MAMPYVQDGVFRVYVKGNAARAARWLAGLRKREKQTLALRLVFRGLA